MVVFHTSLTKKTSPLLRTGSIVGGFSIRGLRVFIMRGRELHTWTPKQRYSNHLKAQVYVSGPMGSGFCEVRAILLTFWSFASTPQ